MIESCGLAQIRVCERDCTPFRTAVSPHLRPTQSQTNPTNNGVFVFWAAVYSDSDSSDSSLDRRPSGAGPGSGDGGGSGGRPPRKSSTHKRPRRKRAAIPVATPRVPTLPSANSQSTTTNLPPSGMPLPLSARSRGQSGEMATAADKGNAIRSPPISYFIFISHWFGFFLGGGITTRLGLKWAFLLILFVCFFEGGSFIRGFQPTMNKPLTLFCFFFLAICYFVLVVGTDKGLCTE